MIAEDKENIQEANKKLSLSSGKKSRFHYKTEKEMEELSRGYVPPNTEKNTKWATKCFKEWIFSRNVKIAWMKGVQKTF